MLITNSKSNSNIHFSLLRDKSEKVNLSIITRYTSVPYDNRAFFILPGRVFSSSVTLFVYLYNILIILPIFLENSSEIPAS
jgi:hypothetical protein